MYRHFRELSGWLLVKAEREELTCVFFGADRGRENHLGSPCRTRLALLDK